MSSNASTINKSADNESGYLDEIAKFLKDLVLGDFEEDQGKAAMVVGGVISLIPIVDQIMDARDVAGMIFRLSKKGVTNATKDDWFDLALAAFGCIPEVGSLFKTIIKPLRKLRKESKLTGAVPGSLLVENMLGSAKGSAIKFFKVFNWGQRTQQAIALCMCTLDQCIELLDYLAAGHWWEPDDLRYLAKDLTPRVKQIRAPLKAGIQQGALAIQDLVRDMLGEDALWVAQKVAYAATVVGNEGARHNNAGAAKSSMAGTSKKTAQTHSEHAPTKNKDAATAKKTKSKPSPGKGVEHKEIEQSHRQSAKEDKGQVSHLQRSTKDLLEDIAYNMRGLVGEHMADYYHMEHVLKAKGAWPHGDIHGKWTREYPRLVGPHSKEARPSELIPEDLKKVTTSGVDSIWQIDASTYHFIEAKTSECAGSAYGLGQRRMTSGVIPRAPANLNDRQLLLWSLLSEPLKGTQMGRQWIKRSVPDSLATEKNLKNRWVYLILYIPTISNPFAKMRKGMPLLTFHIAPGCAEHLQGVYDILSSGDCYKVALHDVHKPTHGVSETFLADEIDFVDKERKEAKRIEPNKEETESKKTEKTEKKPSASTKQNRKRNKNNKGKT